MTLLKKEKISVSVLLRMIVVPTVLGLTAGVVGALTAESYLAASPMQEPPPIQIGRTIVSVTSPLPEVKIAERLKRIDIPLYARKAASGTDAADRARSHGDIVGYAAVLTSDGWLATHQSVVNGPVAAAIDGRLIEPKTQVTDPRTGITFLKIDASALPVSGFEETDALSAGAPLYVEEVGGLFAPATFAGAVPSDRKIPTGSLRSSDRFSRAFRLDRALSAHAVGGAVLTAGGNLAGIVVPSKEGNDAFVPMHEIRPILAEVFGGKTPVRALLGANYLMLDETVFSGERPAVMAGALISASRMLGLAAVRPGSAAARAGLRDGDVIVSADGVALSDGRDLAELVAEYEPGAKIQLEILRAGVSSSIEVTFD